MDSISRYEIEMKWRQRNSQNKLLQLFLNWKTIKLVSLLMILWINFEYLLNSFRDPNNPECDPQYGGICYKLPFYTGILKILQVIIAVFAYISCAIERYPIVTHMVIYIL